MQQLSKTQKMDRGYGLVKLKKIKWAVIGVIENCPAERLFKIYLYFAK